MTVIHAVCKVYEHEIGFDLQNCQNNFRFWTLTKRVNFEENVERCFCHLAIFFCHEFTKVILIHVNALFFSFMDVIQIEKTGENFRLIYDVKGRYTIHRYYTQLFKVSPPFLCFYFK